MSRDYFVYILTDKGRKTLYIGVTNDLPSRLWQHRNPEKTSFSQRYHCIVLVYYEQFPDPLSAIAREKKVALIEAMNPRWDEISADWL